MAKLIFFNNDLIINTHDHNTRAQLKNAMTSEVEIICCDYCSCGPSQYILQDVIRYSKKRGLETYKFDQEKSVADSTYHLIPTGKLKSVNEDDECILGYAIEFAVNSYDAFILNHLTEFVYESRPMKIVDSLGNKVVSEVLMR